MRTVLLAVSAAMAAAALAAAPACAQDKSMADVVRQMRETANQMEGKLSAAEIAEMRQQADEIEAGMNEGAFKAPAQRADPKDVVGRIMGEHGGILDWLENETACAGYSWETYKTYRLDTGDRDAQRDVLCQKAFGHMADYVRLARNGERDKARVAVEAYDKAAREAVRFYGK